MPRFLMECNDRACEDKAHKRIAQGKRAETDRPASCVWRISDRSTGDHGVGTKAGKWLKDVEMACAVMLKREQKIRVIM